MLLRRDAIVGAVDTYLEAQKEVEKIRKEK